MDRAEREQLHRWMARLADGDREAFRPVFLLTWPLLRRFAERALGGSPDADDAAQSALIKVFAQAHEFDPVRDALPWLLGIAAYECRTYRQKARRRREDTGEVDSMTKCPAAGPDPEQEVLARDLEAAALDLLGNARPADLETITAMMQGQRPPVAAATFRKRLERALDRLRAAWRTKHGVE